MVIKKINVLEILKLQTNEYLLASGARRRLEDFWIYQSLCWKVVNLVHKQSSSIQSA